jgi:hypothetical protein
MPIDFYGLKIEHPYAAISFSFQSVTKADATSVVEP